MKYKLTKKLNGIPEWLVFKYNKPKISFPNGENFQNRPDFIDYIELVWIDDKDSFEIVKEDILVPDEINILIWDGTDNLFIWKGRQALWRNSDNRCVIGTEWSEKAKCKLIKTTVWELEAGDVFYNGEIEEDELEYLYHYIIYTWELEDGYNVVFWNYKYSWIGETHLHSDGEVYKVVKV